MRSKIFSATLFKRLTLLAIAGILPVAVATGIAIYALVDSQREAAVAKSLEVTRLAASAIDVQLQRNIAALRILALSPTLDSGKLDEFAMLIDRLLADTSNWQSISLLTPDAKLVRATNFTPGDSSYLLADTISFAEVIERREPVVGRLIKRAGDVWGIAIRLPVLRQGELKYVISAVVSPESFQDVVESQGLPDNWTLSVFDAGGARIARSRDAEKHMGTFAAPTLVQLMARPDALFGTGPTTTLEGDKTYSAFVRLPWSGWSVAIGIPTTSVLVGRNRSLMLYGGGALASILLALLAASLLAQRINRPIHDLRAAADLFGKGGIPPPVKTRIHELSALGGALNSAAIARAKTDRKLLEQEQFLNATFQQAAIGIATANLEGRFERVNQRFCNILGYTTEELRERTVRDVTHSIDQELTQARIGDLLAGRIAEYTLEKRYVRKDGSSVWCKATVNLLRDHTGAPRWFIAAVDDISHRMQTELALRRSEEIASTVVANSDDCIFMLEGNGRIVWTNDHVLRALPEHRAGTQAGSSWIDLWRPEDRVTAREAISSAQSQGVGAMVGCIEGRDRSNWWDVRMTVIHGAEGTADQLLAVAREVTDRFQDEGAMRDEGRILEILNTTGAKLASQLELKELVQSVTDAATELCGAQFGAFFYNTIDERGNAYQLYTLSGAPIEAFSKFGHPRATPIFAPTFTGGAPIRVDDVMADSRYGNLSPHYGMPKGHLPVRSYLAVSVISRSGEVIGGLFFGHPAPGVFTERSERLIVGLAAQAAVAIDNARLYERSRHDAAERAELLESERAARAQAERESSVKDEFLATLSHELRTPLSAILGWAQILRRQNIGEDERMRGVETIERNARIQAQLIDDLLDMSRIVAGKVRLDVQSLMPAEVVEAAIAALRPAIDAKAIKLGVVLDSSAGPVNGDPSRLQQVVWNLLSNAIKFTPRDGRIQVTLKRFQSSVEIGVTDTGVGIQTDLLARIFERFRQADSSTTRRHGGLGLGLAICKQLVELHGGTIKATSQGEGKGSAFTVYLPIAAVGELHVSERAPVASPAPALAPLVSPPDLSGVRVLVVDDDRDTRELIARLLDECGAIILTASSAQEGLVALKSARPDVLLSDIGMPDIDGYEFLKRVRALNADEGGNTPAIALTAFARSVDRTRALHAGFLVHVAKPVEPAELLVTVASVAKRLQAESS